MEFKTEKLIPYSKSKEEYTAIENVQIGVYWHLGSLFLSSVSGMLSSESFDADI